MAGEFPMAKVGDLAKSISDTHKMSEDKLIFLNTSDILHGKILHRTYTLVKDWPGQAKKSIRRDDILYSEIRPANGRWAYIDETADDFVVSTKLMVIRTKTKDVSARYLYQFLTSKETSGWLQHLAESRSGTFPQITFDQVASLDIPLPPLPEQRAIASVLGTLDDLIELNRETNEILEEMARALFKSWFVDFDPVRAKLEGRPPAGMDAATAALFSDHFQDSELGQIPKGWEVGPILSQADLLSGGTPKTDVPSYWGGEVPWASAKDVSQCGEAFLVNTERTITKLGVAKSSTKIIPAFATVMVARGATTGRLTMLGHEMAMNQTCYGLRSKSGAPFALYCHARDFSERLVQGGHGSIFDTITTSTFEATDVILPPKELLLAFDRFTGPMFDQILSNLRESRDLATLRDTLLPKLLSGEVSVAEVEGRIGERML
jgi:type I restriction enzyme S subunit